MADQSNQRGYLFNCDHLYNLDVVETFFLEMEEKHGLNNISTEKLYFGVNRMAEICEATIPQLQMDFAVFVLHANESRLSINEDGAGIGYAKVYRALLQATEDKVLIVIGGDDHYRDEDEEEQSVISRWARRKVASQFNEDYLDGRKSFILSWNKQHREIHEEALLHYFDPNKKGKKFEYQPKPKPEEPKVTPPEPKVTPPEPKVTPPPARDIQQEPFVVEDDTEQLVPSDENGARRRSFSDREEQTKEFRGHQEGPSYGATSHPGDYLADTVLLETRMRFGKISYRADDIVRRQGKWQPSPQDEADLMERHESIPRAKVKFVSGGNGSIRCVVTDVTPWWCKCCMCCMYCLMGMIHCLRVGLRVVWEWICNRCRR